MRRVLSLWLPAFAIERRRPPADPAAAARPPVRPAPDRPRPDRPAPARDERPFVLLDETGGRLLLAAVDARAAAEGLTPGMVLADARALVPGLRCELGDPAGDASALARLADWSERYTPWTALDSAAEPGGAAGLWLDVSGCAHLFGGEAALCDDLVGRLRRRGLGGYVGLADTPGAAWAVARYGRTADAAVAIVPPGGQQRALAGLSTAALRLAPARVELLARFGVIRIDELLALPPETLEPRLGPEVARRLRQALGTLPEPLSPRRPVTPHLERLVFGEPTATAEDIARAVERLLLGLCRRLQAVQAGARRLELTLYRVDGSRRGFALGTGRPVRDPDHLRRLFADRLERLDPGFGIDAMTLAAPRVEALSALQLTLAAERRPRDAVARGAIGVAAEGDLAALLDRLAGRLGPDNLGCQGARQSHLPERAVARLAPQDAVRGGAPAVDWPATPPRPARLLARPEPVEALAPLPDRPPVQFRWRRVLHRVTRAEGPERIAPEWWLADAAAAGEGARDYFRVEDEDGRRFWLYRSDGRWFLQGLFA